MKASTFTVKPLPTTKKFGKIIFMNSEVRILTVVKKKEAKTISINRINQKP
ncbi:MAG TPA: hypothetical protein VF487_07985 [Chitinophagaceae bacterium]